MGTVVVGAVLVGVVALIVRSTGTAEYGYPGRYADRGQ